MTMIGLIVSYGIPISLLAILATVYDKFASKRKGARRIPETTLWTIALVGGAGAMYATMRGIRHKTRHSSFMMGLPLIFLGQIVGLWLLFGFF